MVPLSNHTHSLKYSQNFSGSVSTHLLLSGQASKFPIIHTHNLFFSGSDADTDIIDKPVTVIKQDRTQIGLCFADNLLLKIGIDILQRPLIEHPDPICQAII